MQFWISVWGKVAWMVASNPVKWSPLRPVFQAVEYRRPELGVLIFANPHPQNIFPAIQIDANGNIYCFLHDLPFTADMVVDGIQNTTA